MRVREGRKGLEDTRAEEAIPRVRERSRWFEPLKTRWGVEPHRVAEARGETPVAGQLSDARAYGLASSSEARQLRSCRGFHTHAHLTPNKPASRGRERGHFGAGLALWL